MRKMCSKISTTKHPVVLENHLSNLERVYDMAPNRKKMKDLKAYYSTCEDDPLYFLTCGLQSILKNLPIHL